MKAINIRKFPTIFLDHGGKKRDSIPIPLTFFYSFSTSRIHFVSVRLLADVIVAMVTPGKLSPIHPPSPDSTTYLLKMHLSKLYPSTHPLAHTFPTQKSTHPKSTHSKIRPSKIHPKIHPGMQLRQSQGLEDHHLSNFFVLLTLALDLALILPSTGCNGV